MTQPLSPVGEILERARGEMSKREAARRAGISEGRWRQIVTGRQTAGGIEIPVNPRRETLLAMARAVGADPTLTVAAAGFRPDVHFDLGIGTKVEIGRVDHRRPNVGPDDQDDDDEIRYQRPEGISDSEWETRKRTAQATLRALFEEYQQ